MMGFIVTHVLVIALLPLMLALASEGLAFFGAIPDWGAFQWVGIGLLVSLPVHLILHASLIRLVGTMEHELCHFVASYLFFGRVERITASQDKGGETLSWPNNVLIYLAPYFLPVLTLPLLGIRLLVTAEGLPIIDALIGGTLGLHYLRIADNLTVKQDDFVKAGFLPSVTVTPVMNIVFLVIIAAGVLNDYGAVPHYLANVIPVAAANYDVALRWLQQASAELISLIS